MKIVHAEDGGIVIYNMKREYGTIQLPEHDPDNKATSRDVVWADQMVTVQGYSPAEMKRSSRWNPVKKV